MKPNRLRPWLSVITGSESLISTAGAALLTQTAQVSGLDRAMTTGLRRWRPARAIHDAAKIVTDLAITVALGGDCAADIAVLCAQPCVFGPVASDPTVSRAIDRLATAGPDALAAIRQGTRGRPSAGVATRRDTPPGPWWLIRVHEARASSRRARWLVRVRSSGWPFHQAWRRIRLTATAALACSRRVLVSPR